MEATEVNTWQLLLPLAAVRPVGTWNRPHGIVGSGDEVASQLRKAQNSPDFVVLVYVEMATTVCSAAGAWYSGGLL